MRREITITAEPRESRGKNEARRLRVRGFAPGIVYGPGSEPVAVAVSPKEVKSILKSSAGHNTIFNINVSGAAYAGHDRRLAARSRSAETCCMWT